MKKIGLIAGLAVAAAAAAPSIASAQNPQPWGVGIAGGATFPTGQMRDVAGNGVTVQGTLGFTAPFIPIGLRADAVYNQIPHVQGYRFREYGGLVNTSVGIPIAGARPYVIGGVGAMHHNAPARIPGQPAIGEGGTHFAWAAGGGLQLNLGGRAGFLEARYMDTGEGRRTIPVTLGVQF